MSRPVCVLLLCCALLACRKDAPPPAPVTPKTRVPLATVPPTPDYDVDNFLNLMYGSAVVSRGGELHLENSAIHTIDGFVETTWTSAPGAPEETIVYSMLAPTRIQRVGVSTGVGEDVMESVAFDTSMDGRSWTPLTTLETERVERRQFVTVKPVVAQYLRVRTLDPPGRYYVRLRGVHATGEEVAPPRTPTFGGCWTINGIAAELEQTGARITGTIATEPPTVINGGTDNRAAMVMWMQGAAWGYAVLTRSPDGERLSGLSFYEDVDVKYVGEGWFGERCDSAERRLPAGRFAAFQAARSPGKQAGRMPAERPAGSRRSATPAAFLARTKRYSLYGVAFDPNGRILEDVSAPALDDLVSLLGSTPQKLRIVAHELRYDTREQNRKQAAARLESLRAALGKRGVNLARIDFVNAGGDWDGPVLRSALQRSLVSRVDIVSGT